jgi:hypothetical protein
VKRLSARRPSPALVISCIALFVSMGGVSYGLATGVIDSREIKNNTIRTQDLRNNEVRTGDIRNSTVRGRDVAVDTITGADVNESTLGQVPDAATLGGAFPGSFAKATQQAVRLIGVGAEAAFQNGFENSACNGCPAVGYWKDSIGNVHLQGSLQGPTDGTAFTLPPGYRPTGDVRFLASASVSDAAKHSVVFVQDDGAVKIVDAEANHDTSLNGVSFRAG